MSPPHPPLVPDNPLAKPLQMSPVSDAPSLDALLLSDEPAAPAVQDGPDAFEAWFADPAPRPASPVSTPLPSAARPPSPLLEYLAAPDLAPEPDALHAEMFGRFGDLMDVDASSMAFQEEEVVSAIVPPTTAEPKPASNPAVNDTKMHDSNMPDVPSAQIAQKEEKIANSVIQPSAADSKTHNAMTRASVASVKREQEATTATRKRVGGKRMPRKRIAEKTAVAPPAVTKTVNGRTIGGKTVPGKTSGGKTVAGKSIVGKAVTGKSVSVKSGVGKAGSKGSGSNGRGGKSNGGSMRSRGTAKRVEKRKGGSVRSASVPGSPVKRRDGGGVVSDGEAGRKKRREGSGSPTGLLDGTGRKRDDDERNMPVLDKCTRCDTTKKNTPMMRKGPDGCRSLCNACGLKWSRHGIY